MSHPPHKPPHQSANGQAQPPDNLPPANLPAVTGRQGDPSANGTTEGSGGNDVHDTHGSHGAHDQRRVIEAEIILDSHHNGQGHHDRLGHGSQNSGQGHGPQGSHAGGGSFFYRRNFGGHGGFQSGNAPFGHIWMTNRNASGACLAPCVTAVIFLVCLAQFGFLAGLGFVFFHTLGAVFGILRQMRSMTEGRLPNPWVWRLGNWMLSFLITAWLAGGFD